MTLEEMLIADEGLRLKFYSDSVGIPTLGVGRNIKDIGITYDEAMFLLKNDIHRVKQELCLALPQLYAHLSPLRQKILENMAFNLGTPRLMGFVKFLAALEEENYPLAAHEMLQSQWAHQVKRRAQRLARWIQTDREGDA